MNRLLKRENLAFILGSCSDECVCFLPRFLPSPSVEAQGWIWLPPGTCQTYT